MSITYLSIYLSIDYVQKPRQEYAIDRLTWVHASQVKSGKVFEPLNCRRGLERHVRDCLCPL